MYLASEAVGAGVWAGIMPPIICIQTEGSKGVLAGAAACDADAVASAGAGAAGIMGKEGWGAAAGAA